MLIGMRENGIVPIPYGTFFSFKPVFKAHALDASGEPYRDPMLKALESKAEGPSSLVEQVAARPYALEDLEAFVRTLAPSATDSDGQYRFYPVLAEAFASAGRLQAEFAALEKKVEAGDASKKDILIWMELALRQPADVARRIMPAAEKAIAQGGDVSDYQRIQLARLSARAGLQDQAAEIYSVTSVWAMSKTGEFNIFGRNTGTSLFSPLGLCADAGKYLDGAHIGKLLLQLAKISEPPGTSAVERRWHERFVLYLMDQGIRSGVPLDTLRPLLDSIGPGGGRMEDRVRFAEVQSRFGTADQALGALKAALAQGETSPSGAPDIVVNINASIPRYATSLGFSQSLSAMGILAPPGADDMADAKVLSLFSGMFPSGPDGWAAAREWTARAGQALPAWAEESEGTRNTAVELLALVALREHQMGMPEAAASGAELSRLLGRFDTISSTAVTFAVAVGEEIGSPVATAVARGLIDRRVLDVRQVAAVVRRLGQTDAAAGLELGGAALAYTRNDALLAEMESLAGKAGKDAEVARFREMRKEADAARAVLNGPAAPADPGKVAVR
jgi:hypothetical protein